MKASVIALPMAFIGTAFSQEIFRCMCVDNTSDPGRTGLSGIDSLCTSKGGEVERPDLCIKSTSRFTDAECAKVKQGARGICIVDEISNGGGSTAVVTATAAP
ncbi:uncharacterized protein CTRU02_205001 [Colletotrichum truncatum]|uniref:Uncharacterized protein n=1 Tax=Colletotrichum truncatum TaxID=5467 RepID=A0ACC3Z2S4_COLTU|nr:uncharacterized protein CTRU02_06170 [Colletotrichum truncatum]KAF6793298.1 hypothetical protein CTRU02_06170 [Colletotrichum truncatum]